MKEFLRSTLGKVIVVLAAVLVFGGIGIALMFGGKDSDKETQGGESDGLIVIEEGEETDEDVIDATDWEDLTGEAESDADDKRDTDQDGTPDKTDDDDDNDEVPDAKDDDDDNDGTPDKEDPDHPSNTDKDEDNKDEDNKDEDNKDEEVKDPSGESWGPFF